MDGGRKFQGRDNPQRLIRLVWVVAHKKSAFVYLTAQTYPKRTLGLFASKPLGSFTFL
jgi:hypothetical protein